MLIIMRKIQWLISEYGFSKFIIIEISDVHTRTAHHAYTFEPRYDKTGFLHMQKKDTDSGNPEADQRLCFRYIASTIPLLPKYKISSL